MRPFPSDYGRWDTLLEGPPEARDQTDPDVADVLARRDRLTEQWSEMVAYPRGVWSDAAIESDPDQAEAWRNWFTRRAWEGIAMLNAQLARLAARSIG